MLLNKINLVMTTVWREENYLDETLKGLFTEYPVSDDQPFSLVIGSPQITHLTHYRSIPGIRIIEMGSHAWSWIKSSDVRHRATWNYYRCLTQPIAGSRGTLVLEDDVRFARGWFARFDATLAALEEKFASRFVLSIYDLYGWKPEENDLYATYPYKSFTGTQGVYYPTAIRLEFAKYLKLHGVVGNKDHYDYLLRDYLIQENIPLFASVPSLIQHIGKNTTGVGVWHEAPNFVEDVTVEPVG